MSRGISGRKAALAVVCFIGFLVAMQLAAVPLVGDDLVYKGAFEGPHTYSESWLRLPNWILDERRVSNGRVLNLLLPLLLALPQWVLAGMCGAFAAVMIWQGARAAGCRSGLATVTFAAASLVVLPWWDSMTLFACQTNYVAASALLLISYNLMTDDKVRCLWLWIPVVAIAGACHEGASVPLLVGLTAYYAVNRRRPDWYHFALLAAFAAGALFVTFSPGILSRASLYVTPDDPWALLALKNTWAVMLMLVAIAYRALTRGGRKHLAQMLKSPYAALAVAALLSGIISVMSGIVGRSGWFAQLFALVVVARMMQDAVTVRRLRRLAGAVVGGAAVTWLVLVTGLQMKASAEYREFLTAYSTSENGVVRMSQLDERLPWWLTGHVRTIPAPDDIYLLKTIRDYYRPFAELPLVISSTSGIVADSVPQKASTLNLDREKVEMMVYCVDGKEMVVRPFSEDGHRRYYYAERRFTPGER